MRLVVSVGNDYSAISFLVEEKWFEDKGIDKLPVGRNYNDIVSKHLNELLETRLYMDGTKEYEVYEVNHTEVLDE